MDMHEIKYAIDQWWSDASMPDTANLAERLVSLMGEAKPLDEWHEDDGPVLWWYFPVEEPPYSGTPLDQGFPDYVTHFTRLIVPALSSEARNG